MLQNRADRKTSVLIKKPVRGFLLSVSFAGLIFLAFNPYVVVDLQDALGLSDSGVTVEVEEPDQSAPPPPKQIDAPVLPITAVPDSERLPRIEGFDQIAKHDLWIDDAPCGVDIFETPRSLSGLGPRQDGGPLTDPLKAVSAQDILNQPTYRFESRNGVTLRVVEPVVKYYQVTGRSFREAQSDIVKRKPLDESRNYDIDPDLISPDREGNIATLANILSPTLLSYTTFGSRDHYRLLAGQTELTSAFVITLPAWKNYEDASAKDQAKWDDLVCNASHHELGHLRIRLDILAETLDGYAALPPAQTRAELGQLTADYRAEINARIDNRQDAYHIYNGGGLRRGMIELPYAELPFPWLSDRETEPLQSAD
ncbi:hypothetical protein GCM10011309_16080 [Litorimonas cladophorae]|uniref:DUF922 domain-containing protein n=1 Tax=Litorimonas cladophorae TaxID=1220491 RepID=A0A918KMC5_9PROT|nr:DUF922 domain-containing protein [Litorimonas cladophorae]GGX67209.1 hypothetical protein GCM10011309_16080 [Litorimonas cladophorae]